MNASFKKILKYIPAGGFFIGALLSLQNAAALWLTIMAKTADGVTIAAELLTLTVVLILFFLAYGAIKFEDKIFKLAAVISLLAFVSLFSSLNIINLIIAVSGLMLFINKKIFDIE